MNAQKMEEIKNTAKEMKEKYDFLSLEELIEAMGITLKVLPDDDTLLDGGLACYFNIKGKPIIYLSNTCPSSQQAFVLAHELGHAVLHDVEMARYGLLFKSCEMEQEADYFAICLLDIKPDPYQEATAEDFSKMYGIRETAAKYLVK